MSEPESKELKPPGATPPPPPPEAPGPDDPGTQALSDALRSSFYIIQFIMVLLVVVFLASGFFTVKEQNKAIILRLGRPVGTGDGVLLMPGPHFAFPRPIDEVTNVPFTALQHADSTLGWYRTAEDRARGGPDPMPTGSIDPSSTVSYMLTADTNIIHAKAVATYRITKPITYYFEFADAAGFVTNDLDNALLFAASRFTVDNILSIQPAVFREAVEARMRDLLDQQGLGITLDRVDVDSAPALALTPDFLKVVQAGSERETTISQAHIYESQVLANARAGAALRTNSALTDVARMVGLLQAEQTNFSHLVGDFQRNPDVVTNILQADAIRKVWTNAQSTILLPGYAGQLRIHLGEPIPALTLSTNQPGQ